MTNTPIMNVGFSYGSFARTNNTKMTQDSAFSDIFNGQNNNLVESGRTENSEVKSLVKKTPGESMKVRNEHRARTEKREPSRNAEERTDIPDDKLEEAAEVLNASAANLIEKVAETFSMEVEEVQSIMDEMGMNILDILDAKMLGELVLQISGAEDMSAFVFDEELYGQLQELTTAAEELQKTNVEEFDMSVEELTQAVKEATLGRTEDVQADAKDKKADYKLEEIPTAMNAFASQNNDTVSESSMDSQNEKRQFPERSEKSPQSREGDTQPIILGDAVKYSATEAINLYNTENVETFNQVDPQDVMRQIMDYMKVHLTGDSSSIEMQLHPASLGTVQVQLTAKGGEVAANFITQNEAVKAALESQMVQLQEHFEEQGIKVQTIEVSVQTNAFERNLNQGQEDRDGSFGREPSRRGRIRRINLNDIADIDGLDEEDVMTREMMASNGNTVDYTA